MSNHQLYSDPNLASEWEFPSGVTYLNHGSFGPSPRCVRAAQQSWTDELERNPMEFFVRRQEGLLDEALKSLGRFIGSRSENLTFVPNATSAMNIVARNTPLAAGDEVLLNDHEYGAVIRIWGSRCRETGAKTVLAKLPVRPESDSQWVDALFERVTPRTRMIVISHVTSATAVIFPVELICQRAKSLGIPVCIDGPHAIAMVPLALDQLGCDYYCASLHKWLSAPFGSGFLYASPRHKSGLKPTTVSWGRSLSGQPGRWVDEFHWPGTANPAPYLAVPEAIRFLEHVGLDRFRNHGHTLAARAAQRLGEKFDACPLVHDSLCGTMITLEMPRIPRIEQQPGTPPPLQLRLATEFGIEIPVVEWQERMHLRVSCHLYNGEEQIEQLVEALQKCL